MISINYSINFNKKLRLVSLNQNHGYVDIWDKSSNEPLRQIKAHNNKLECIQINNNGEYLATASNRGTIIRIFNVNNGEKIKEFRRGYYNKIINNLVFNEYTNLLMCTTISGSIDLFQTGLNNEINNMEIEKQESIFNIFGNYIQIRLFGSAQKLRHDTCIILSYRCDVM